MAHLAFGVISIALCLAATLRAVRMWALWPDAFTLAAATFCGVSLLAVIGMAMVNLQRAGWL